jgi:protein-S-isoprenylcysteine O-methyltransferase Ste14
MSGKKILPPIYLYSAIGLMIALHFMLPGMRVLSRPLTFLGFVPLAAGVAINLLADKAFSQRGTTVKPFQESSTLVTTGVFRITRNPMYLGFTLILIGIALLAGTLTPWIVIPIFAVLMDVVFIRAEEKMLEEKFGQAFVEYKQHTRRWV